MIALSPSVYQDGGQFYQEPDGKLIADYDYLVAHDHDTKGAEAARERFAEQFPQHVRGLETRAYIVFWLKGGRLGSVPFSAENMANARKTMRLSLIQTDATGTVHYRVTGLV